MAYQMLTQIDGELPSSQHSLNVRKRFVLPLLTEWRMFLNIWIFEFRVEFVQNGGWKVTICISVSPARSSSVGPLLTNILRIYYECLPTLANAFTNVANAYARFTNVTNAYENHAEWPSSQHSLKFTNRFVNWAIFVRRWGIICEVSEFVTNAYEDTANAAKFERLSNMSFR